MQPVRISKVLMNDEVLHAGQRRPQSTAIPRIAASVIGAGKLGPSGVTALLGDMEG